MPKTSLTHTLARLNKAGLIAFEVDPKDSRSKLVVLTEEGAPFAGKRLARSRRI